MPIVFIMSSANLQNYCVMEADRDAIGDAFEVFIGPALRGAEGQFFTPRNVVKMMVEILDPKPGEKNHGPCVRLRRLPYRRLGKSMAAMRTPRRKQNGWKPETTDSDEKCASL